MAGVGQPAVERLRAFLRDLHPGSKSQLINELERALLRGDEFTGYELILNELRRSFRDNDPKRQRMGHAARAFFRPLDPFLIDETFERALPGRVARDALEPVWNWLSLQVLPAEAQSFTQQFESAQAAHDTVQMERLTSDFQDSAAQEMQALIAAAGNNEKATRRLGGQIGTSHGFEDLQSIMAVYAARDVLGTLSARLPGHIRQFSGSALESAKSQLDPHAVPRSNLLTFGLSLTMGRLAAPWQLIRLAIRAANSDTAARISETPYSMAVNIVLGEIERMVLTLETDLKSGRGIAMAALLKDVHDSVRGLRSELDLATDSPWGKQLAALRTTISRVLTAQIEMMTGRVRQIMRPRPAREIAAGSELDMAEVAEVETMIGFLIACRNYASELAINEVSQRSFTELQQCLDSGTRALLDALRATGDKERPFRQSQVDAAVRFCAKVFGKEYAALLTKAADVAAHSQEPRLARA